MCMFGRRQCMQAWAGDGVRCTFPEPPGTPWTDFCSRSNGGAPAREFLFSLNNGPTIPPPSLAYSPRCPFRLGKAAQTLSCCRSSARCSPTKTWCSMIAYGEGSPPRVRPVGGSAAVACAHRMKCDGSCPATRHDPLNFRNRAHA